MNLNPISKTILIALIFSLFAYGMKAEAQNKCIDDTWHEDTAYATDCTESLGSCWVRTRDASANRRAHPTMDIPIGMIDPAKDLDYLTEGETSGWAAQCTFQEPTNNKLQPICGEGLYAYVGKFGTSCKAASGESKIYTCWSNQTQYIIEGAVDGGKYGADGWQVQCQLGTDPLEPENENLVDIPSDNSNRGFVWSEAYLQSSLLMDFEAQNHNNSLVKEERKRKLLEKFIDRVTFVLSKRDDKNPLTSKNEPVWSSTVSPKNINNAANNPSYPGGSNSSPSMICSDAGQDGLILTPFAEFLYMYAQKKYLFSAQLKQELDLDTFKTELELRISETLAYHQENSWEPQAIVNGEQLFSYTMDRNCDKLDSAGEVLRQHKRLPFNLVAPMAGVHYMLYKSNGEQIHLEKAKLVAKDLKYIIDRTLQITGENVVSPTEVYWAYQATHNDIPLLTQEVNLTQDDQPHAFLVARFIKLLADDQVVFGKGYVDGISRTLRHYTLTSSDHIYVHFGPRKDPVYTKAQVRGETPISCDSNGCAYASEFGRSLALYFPFLPSKGWIDYAKPFVPSFSSGFDKLAQSHLRNFTRTQPRGAQCTVDGQCVSDVCYQGAICDLPATNTTTCNRDKECGSGNCAYNVVEHRFSCQD